MLACGPSCLKRGELRPVVVHSVLSNYCDITWLQSMQCIPRQICLYPGQRSKLQDRARWRLLDWWNRGGRGTSSMGTWWRLTRWTGRWTRWITTIAGVQKVGGRRKLALTLVTRGRTGRSAQMTLLLGLSDDSGCCSSSPPFAAHAYLGLVWSCPLQKYQRIFQVENFSSFTLDHDRNLTMLQEKWIGTPTTQL